MCFLPQIKKRDVGFSTEFRRGADRGCACAPDLGTLGEAVQLSPQERVQNCTQEQILDSPVPQITEDGLPIVPQVREQNRTREQIVDVLVPHITEAVCLLHHRNACRISRRRLWISRCLRTWEIMRELCVLHLRSSCRIVPSCVRPRRKSGMVFSMCLRSACQNVMGIATSRAWTSTTCLVPELSRT